MASNTKTADLPVKNDVMAELIENKTGVCAKGGHYHVYNRTVQTPGFSSIVISQPRQFK